MNHDPRRAVRAALLAVLAAGPGWAGDFRVPRVALPAALGAASAPSAFAAAGVSAAAIAPPALGAAPVAALPSALSAAPSAAAVPASAPARASGPAALGELRSAAAGAAERDAFDGRPVESATTYEGVRVTGRAARYFREVERLVGKLQQAGLNLGESLDVMDDTYGDVVAKVSAVEAIARERGLGHENTHLEETLMWVDGTVKDEDKTVAVHTHRVFFHHAKNPRSEIEEGIRRVDGYIAQAERNFSVGGLAERQLGPIDAVELVFDSRGYPEIKDHLKKRAEEVAQASDGRIRFKYADEIAPLPAGKEAIRAKLNELSERHQGQGLDKIIEGVTYSRLVGMLLELKTVEHYHDLGYKILQSGRELFDAQGMYVTELDSVVQAPDGKVLLVEAKSSRVNLPFEEILQDKVIRKLETYRKFKPQLDAAIGVPFDEVVFAVDVGNQHELEPLLKAEQKKLSREYGFPVSFLFLESGPKTAARR